MIYMRKLKYFGLYYGQALALAGLILGGLYALLLVALETFTWVSLFAPISLIVAGIACEAMRYMKTKMSLAVWGTIYGAFAIGFGIPAIALYTMWPVTFAFCGAGAIIFAILWAIFEIHAMWLIGIWLIMYVSIALAISVLGLVSISRADIPGI